MPQRTRTNYIEGLDRFVDEPAYGSLDNVSRRTDTSTISGQDGGDILTSARYFDDGQDYVNTILQQNDDAVRQAFEAYDAGHFYNGDPVKASNRLDELDGTSTASNIRGDIAEDTLLPELERQKYGVSSYDTDAGELSDGYIPEDDIPFKMDSEQTGFDGMAVNDDGDLVIIETKANSNSDRLVASDLGDTNAGRQLSEDWIEQKFESWTKNPSDAQREFLETFDSENHIDLVQADGEIVDVQINNIITEFVGYQNNGVSTEFASSTLRKSNPQDPTVNIVEVVKTGDVFPAPQNRADK